MGGDNLYYFVDTTEPSSIVPRSLQTIYKDINLDEELTDENGSFITLNVTGRNTLRRRVALIDVLGMDGSHEENEVTEDVREIVVSYKLKDKTNGGFINRFDKLKGLISNQKEKLEFTDDDKFYYATLYNLETPEENTRDLVGTITFVCSDPFKYGQEKELNFTDDSIIIDNKGTASSKPIIELTAKEKSTFAMVTLGDEQFNIIGQPADDDVQIVDSRTSVLYENGSTIGDWQVATLDMVDTYHIDAIGGQMTTDGQGIRADGYGTGQKWHGPAVFKEINPIQDFELSTAFDIISEREADSFRMGIMLFDENMNNIGHLGVKDDSRYYKRRTPLGRVGYFGGEGREARNVIGDKDRVDGVSNTTIMNLRMKRVGQRFDFFIGEWRNQRYIRVWNGHYIDVNNEFTGKLKFITLYIANFKDRLNPLRLRINSVEVFELATIQQDQTPYIIYPGDVVTFDHVNADVLLNGELSKDNFFGDFFELEKGQNHLTITPEDTFDTKITYKERFR